MTSTSPYFARFGVYLSAAWLVGFIPPALGQTSGPEDPTSKPVPKTVEFIENITYSERDPQAPLCLDLARPRVRDGLAPAVIVIHGGSWGLFGDRKICTPMTLTLAENGFVAVNVSYRPASKAPFPAQIHDVKAAVRWLRTHASRYSVDPHRIGVLGYSGGGHLGCLLGMTRGNMVLEGTGDNPRASSAVQAVVSYYGVSDMRHLYEHYETGPAPDWSRMLGLTTLKTFMGGTPKMIPRGYRDASPLSYANKDIAPMLLLHGDKDSVVPASQSELLAEKLRKAGAPVTLCVIGGAKHNIGSGYGGAYGDFADRTALHFLKWQLMPQRKTDLPK